MFLVFVTKYKVYDANSNSVHTSCKMNCSSFHYVQFGHSFVWSKERLLVRTLKLYISRVAPKAGAFSSFSSTKQLGVFLHFINGMLV